MRAGGRNGGGGEAGRLLAAEDAAGAVDLARRETKTVPAEMGRADADGVFEGYASLFGREDLGRDRVMPGAFRRSLAARGAAGVKMLWQHEPGEPIGCWLDIREDARGLYVRGRLAPEVARAREALALMRAGAIDGLSIGFRTVKARRDAAGGGRALIEIDLWEISIVTFPLLPEARIAAVKTAGAAGAELSRALAGSFRRAAQRILTMR